MLPTLPTPLYPRMFSSKATLCTVLQLPLSLSHISINLEGCRVYCDCCWRWLKDAAWSHVATTLSEKPCVHLGPQALAALSWNQIQTSDLVCRGTPHSVFSLQIKPGTNTKSGVHRSASLRPLYKWCALYLVRIITPVYIVTSSGAPCIWCE